MSKCEVRHGCDNDAVVILSVGSLGRVEKLCGTHRLLEQGLLDQTLTPYQVTGIEASYSPEQAIANDLKLEAEASDELRERIHRLEADNAALRDRIKSQTGVLHETYRDRIAQLEAENERMQAELRHEPVTRVD